MTTEPAIEVPKYDLTITISGVTPEISDEYELEELLDDPQAWFNLDPVGINDWLRSVDYEYSLDQVEAQ